VPHFFNVVEIPLDTFRPPRCFQTHRDVTMPRVGARLVSRVPFDVDRANARGEGHSRA
jgi:hypothetical protein